MKLDFQDTLPHKESERNIVGWTCHEIQAFRIFSEHTNIRRAAATHRTTKNLVS